MANPAWFNYSTYMANKLASLQAADPDAGWTADSVAQAFADAGFTGVEGAYDHFNQYGNTADENISPNDLFVPDQYYKFKAKDYFEHDSVSEVTAQEAAFIKTAIHDAGMSAWQHYIDYGTKEGINPSNSFDTQKYLEAKAAALNAAGSTTTWTAETVAEAFAAAGMNALSHAIEYSGKGDNEAAAVFDASGAVVDAYKVDDKTSDDDTQTYTLTVNKDTVVGTSGDDVIEAPIMDGGKATLTAGDNIDGGAGTDTINVYGNGSSFSGVTMKNVEIINDYSNSATTNVSNFDGVTEVNEYGDLAAVTANVSTKVGFVGAKTTTPNLAVTFADASGDSDAATVALNGATAAQLTVANVEDLTVELTGENQLTGGGLVIANAKNLVVKGDGSLAKDAKGAVTLVDGSGTAATLASIDASGAKGTVALQLADTTAATAFAYTGSSVVDKLDLSQETTNAANNVYTVDLGAGDDVLTVDGYKTKSTFKGGDGSDTVTFAATANVGLNDKDVAAAFSGFETVKFAGTAATTFDYDASLLSGVTTVAVDTTSTGAVSLTNLTNSVAVTVAEMGSGTFTADLKDASDAGSTINVTLDNGEDSAAKGAQIADFASNAHVLSVTSAGNVDTTAGNHNSVTMNPGNADVVNVKISGDQAFDFTAGAASAITKVDGASATGALSLNMSANTAVATVIGGTANDTFTVGGQGDTLTGTNGDDIYVLTAAASGGTAGDVVTSITDFNAGDLLNFNGTALNATVTKVTLAASDNTDALIFAKLATNSTGAQAVSWATYDGKTYVFLNSNADTAVSANDIQVKLTGALTFSDDGVEGNTLTCDA